jgi:hypothetical protein
MKINTLLPTFDKFACCGYLTHFLYLLNAILSIKRNILSYSAFKQCWLLTDTTNHTAIRVELKLLDIFSINLNTS